MGNVVVHLFFYTYSGFKKHLVKAHGDTLATEVLNVDNVIDGVETADVCANDPLNNFPVGQQNLHKKRQLMDICSSVIAQVQAAGVSESIVQSLTCSMEEVVNDVHVQAQDAVLKCLSSEVNEQTLNKVKKCFESLENPFVHLNTETKRKRYFEKKMENC